MAPFTAYLMLRGTVTLPLRVERHNANALRWPPGSSGTPPSPA